MPTALASGSKTVFHYRGNVTPPRDYRQWATLVGTLVGHWVDRYGIRRGETLVLRGLERTESARRSGPGPAKSISSSIATRSEPSRTSTPISRSAVPPRPTTSGSRSSSQFCDRHDLPADFVSTHHYPTDALLTPGTDTDTQLAHSRRSIMRQWAQDTRRRAGGRPLYYTEWNTSSNPRDPRHDEPYAAAFAAKTALEASGLSRTATASGPFPTSSRKHYFPSIPFHGGFGLLTLHGIAKPVYRAFQLLHELGDERLVVDGLHHTVDAWVVRQRGGVTIVLTNHALPQQPIRRERVRLTLRNSARPRSASIRRIDERHANARRAWQKLGASPMYLSSRMVERLESASRLREDAVCLGVRESNRVISKSICPLTPWHPSR